MTSSDFRTTFTLSSPRFMLSAEQGGAVLIGSCFTTEMGERMLTGGYPALVNPCGVQYNPASIARLLDVAMQGDLPDDLFFEHDSLWRCWLLPTAFARASRRECVQAASEAVTALRNALNVADALLITLGTAWIYEHNCGDYRGIVGNCHKVPAREFTRRRLGTQEIVACWLPLIERLRAFRPGLKIIFTVSPIRHFKDGAHENTLSKATLHLASEEIVQACPYADYFPAYELLMDDLRDYRFYAADMLHPSPVAADYIWRHFSGQYFTEDARRRMAACAAAARRAAHRPNIQAQS